MTKKSTTINFLDRIILTSWFKINLIFRIFKFSKFRNCKSFKFYLKKKKKRNELNNQREISRVSFSKNNLYTIGAIP